MKFDFQIGSFRVGIGGEQPKQPPATRSFGSAGRVDRLNSDWLMPRTSADAEIASALITLRDRSRELERTNEYAQRYYSLLDNNVLGANGVGLQMKILDQPGGKLDAIDNDIVLQGWRKWCNKKFCTVSGLHTWRDVEGLVLRGAARDGATLVRLMRGWDNEFGFSIQLLEIDHLDHEYNVKFSNGGEIKFGIEFDPFRKPVAFHLFSSHPGETISGARNRIRVPAKDILHVFHGERIGQSTGYPWMTAAMQALEHLGKYREAELVAARQEACKGYVIEQEKPDGWNGETGANGEQLQENAPGMAMLLDPGQKYVPVNPTHPNTAFGDFNKSTLRGIAGALSVNYNSLANDLESVNYSSMRAGKLEEVEEYKGIQAWLIESLHKPVFEAWLEMALISGALKLGTSPLPVRKFDKFNAPDWKPRRWPWVDPKSDIEAAILAVEKGFKSRREIIGEMGGDVEKVFMEQDEDNKLADSHGLTFPLGANPQQPQPANAQKLTPALK